MAKIKVPRVATGWVMWSNSAWHALPRGFGNWKRRTICGIRPGPITGRQPGEPIEDERVCNTCIRMVLGTWNP